MNTDALTERLHNTLMKRRSTRKGIGMTFYLALGLGLFLFLTAGFAFFFDKILLLAIIGVVGYLVVRVSDSFKPNDMLPLAVLALSFTFIMSGAGIESATAAAGAAMGIGGGDVEADLGPMQGEGSNLPALSATVAPRTYRPVDITIKNTDDVLPLVTSNAKVISMVDACQDEDSHDLCQVGEGQTYTINEGWASGFADFVLQAFNKNNVGLTCQNPEENGLWEKTTLDWQDTACIHNFDDEIALWSQSACDQYAVEEDRPCSQYNQSHTFEDFGYIWADRSANTSTSHTMRTLVMIPQEKGFTEGFITGLTFGAVNYQPYSVVALNEQSVNVTNPDIQIIVVIGAIGLLLALVASRSQLLAGVPIPAL